MAANTISTSLQENIVVSATEALSESMALLSNVTLDALPDPGNKGQSFYVGEYDDKTADAVSASNTSPDADASTFGAATVTLSNHYKANFKLKGTEFQGNNLDGITASQIQECVRAVVYQMNASLLSLYTDIPYIAGNAARSLFNDGSSASVDPLADVGKILNENKVPQNRWKLFVSPTEEANAKKVTALQNANQFGRDNVIYNGYVGRAMGFDIFMDQQIPSHTTGTITTGLTVKSGTTPAVGDTTIVCTTAASTGACALKEGDVVSIDSYTYSLQADVTQASASSDATLTLDRGLESAPSAGDAVTLATGHGSGVINIAGDPSGFGFVSRIEATSFYGGSEMRDPMVITHPSGVSLLAGWYPQYHQQMFEVSGLWGSAVIDSRKLCRGLGA